MKPPKSLVFPNQSSNLFMNCSAGLHKAFRGSADEEIMENKVIENGFISEQQNKLSPQYIANKQICCFAKRSGTIQVGWH